MRGREGAPREEGETKERGEVLTGKQLVAVPPVL